MISTWNPWHGYTRVGTECSRCYVYRRDAEFGKDASIVKKTASFDLPVKRNRQKQYKLQPHGDYVYSGVYVLIRRIGLYEKMQDNRHPDCLL